MKGFDLSNVIVGGNRDVSYACAPGDCGPTYPCSPDDDDDDKDDGK